MVAVQNDARNPEGGENGRFRIRFTRCRIRFTEISSPTTSTSCLMLIRLFQQTPIYSAQPLLDGLERFAPPRISLYDVGLRPVPRPSKVWNAAMGCLRRLWRKTNSSR